MEICHHFSVMEGTCEAGFGGGRESPAYGDDEPGPPSPVSSRRSNPPRKKGHGAIFCCSAAKYANRRMFNA